MNKLLLALFTLLFAVQAATQVPSYVPPAGLLAWYPFSGNANDATTNGHNGTTVGASLTTDRFSATNCAYSFNGTSDYITIPDNPVNFRPQSFTISSWVLFNPSFGSGVRLVISKNLNISTYESTAMWYSGGAWNGDIGNTTGISAPLAMTNAVTTNTWYHFVYQYDASNGNNRIYLNSVLVASGTTPLLLGYNASPWTIGMQYENGPPAYFFNGKIDDIGIWDRVLSACEIKQLYLCVPAATITASTSTICPGQSAVLTATGGNGSYTWSPGGSNASSLLATPSSITTYTVISALGATCPVTYTLNVGATPVLTVSSGSICGGSYTISAAGAANYTYSGGSAVVSPTANTTYTITGASAAGCTVSAQSYVQVGATPMLTVTSGSICSGSYTISATGAANYTYSGGSAVVSPTTNTTYTVIGASASGCTASVQSYVQVEASPVLTVSSGSICSGSYTISATGAVSYTYSGGSAVVSPTTNTTYTIIGASAGGCTASAQSYVQVDAIPVLTVSSGSICGGSYTISAAGAINYTYSGGSAVVSPTINTTYTVTGASAAGCTASAQSYVQIGQPPVIFVNSGTICSGDSFTITPTGAISYTFSGGSAIVSPSANSVYTITGETASTCTAVATCSVNLKAIPVPNLNSNSPVCNGETLYLYGSGGIGYYWTGPSGYTSSIQNPTLQPSSTGQSGVYQVTITATNGCTAPASINIMVNPTPTINLSSAIVCVNQTLQFSASSLAGASYSWTGPNGFSSSQQNPVIAGAILQSSGIYSVLVTSAQNCTAAATTNATVVAMPVASYTTNSPVCYGSSLILDASSSTGGSSYSWLGPNNFSSNQQNTIINHVTVPASGVYTLVVTRGPCLISYTSAQVVINPLPLLTISSPVACEGKPLHLLATGTGSAHMWTGPNGFVSHLPDILFNAVTPLDGGQYNVATTDFNGCVANATTVITVLSTPLVSAQGATICLNGSATLTANGATSYSWKGPFNYSAFTPLAIIPFTGQFQEGTYTVTGMAANGCTATANANVSILPLPSPSIVASSSACIGSTITLQGSGGQNYEWRGPHAFHSFLQTLSLTINNHNMEGSYSLTVSGLNGCKNYTTTQIDVHNIPTGGLVSSALNRCVPYTTNFKLQPNSSFSITSVTWELNNQSYTDQFSYTFTKAGDYILKGTFVDAYCAGTSTFAIKAFAKPLADFSFEPKQPIEDNDHVLFSSSSNSDIVTWYWTIGDAISTYTAINENTSHLFETAGTYPVAMVVRSEEGCMDTIVKTITVQPDFSIFVPNTFTPNNDGRNELFMPVSRNESLLDFAVFDRWGEKLYSTNQPNTGWNGTFQGIECEQDVYVWKLTVTSRNGQQKKLTGYVSLLR